MMNRSERWVALDAVRGITVAGMLLVNNPGTWSAIYPPLEHAPWHGWTPTDLIFPFFLFIVGITTELSLTRRAELGATDPAIRWQIVRRGALIVLAGLLLTSFPYWPITRITAIRIPGVLQRIGVCYALSALLAWRRPTRAVVAWCAMLMLGYWAVLTLIPAPGQVTATIDIPDRTIAGYLDRWLFDGHLWSGSKTWDPEGPLSTVSAIATSLLGIITGRWMRRPVPSSEKLNGLFGAAAIAVVLGSIWGWVFPINKSLWTSSYVLFSAGMAGLVLGTASWLIESMGLERWSRPFVTYGRNPLVAFLGSGLMARAIGSLIMVTTNGQPMPLQQWVFEHAFASWLAPINASLAYALAFVALWYLILLGFDRRGWMLRI